MRWILYTSSLLYILPPPLRLCLQNTALFQCVNWIVYCKCYQKCFIFLPLDNFNDRVNTIVPVQPSIKNLRYFLCRIEIVCALCIVKCRSVEATSKRPLFYSGSCPLSFVLTLRVKWVLIGKLTGRYIWDDKKAPCVDRGVAVSRRVQLNNNLSTNVGHRWLIAITTSFPTKLESKETVWTC